MAITTYCEDWIPIPDGAGTYSYGNAAQDGKTATVESARRRAEVHKIEERVLAMRIAVVGSGYVGLVTGACFATWTRVVLVDNDEKKLTGCGREVPIHEKFLQELLTRIGKAHSVFRRLAAATRASEAVFIRSERRRLKVESRSLVCGVGGAGNLGGVEDISCRGEEQVRCIRASGFGPSS